MQPISFSVVGAGIAGLSAGIALTQQQYRVQLLEQNKEFQEVGAGLQISPNAWRCMRQWGLEEALLDICSLPETLTARNLRNGHVIGSLPLTRMPERFGAPYGTALRTDLHRILIDKVGESTHCSIVMGRRVTAVEQGDQQIQVTLDDASTSTADVLLVADGARSHLGRQIFPHLEVIDSGYTAYRGLLRQTALPSQLRSTHVCAWLGRHLHAVTYPVRKGQFLNIVLVVANHVLEHTPRRGPADMLSVLRTLEQRQDLFPQFKDLCLAVDSHGLGNMGPRWTEWPLQIRRPVRHAGELSTGRVALLGDAAHPMVPFLAQGAAMGIEDAEQLRQSFLAQEHAQAALSHYARARAARCARVQKDALRNGRIFHLGGWPGMARNLAIKATNGHVMDKAWLYAGGPVAV